MRPVEIGFVVDPVKKWDPRRDGTGCITYIDISSVDQITKSIVRPTAIAAAEAPSRARQLVRAGDVLVSTVRPNLNAVAHVKPDLDGATASTGFCVLRPRQDELSDRYLYHWVRATPFVGHLIERATGASYPAVSDKIVKLAPIPLPSVEEQRWIAGVLDAAEALRAKRRQALAKLDTLESSLFCDFLRTNDVTKVAIGQLVHPVAKWNPRLDGTGTFTYIDISSINQDSKSVTHPTTILASDAPSRARQLVTSGDILVSTVRPNLNAVACVRPDLDGATASTGLCVLRPTPSELDSRYLHQWVKSTSFVKHLVQLATGASYPAVSDKIVKASEIPLPSIEAQRRFGGVLDAVEVVRVQQRDGLAALDTLFASLQQRAFRGEL